jgi:kynureninase
MPRFSRWWFCAAVVVPAAITATGLTVQCGGIERTVGTAVRAMVPAAEVVVDGRDVRISGLPAEQLARALRDAGGVPGVREVSALRPEFAPMRITFQGSEIVVTGATGKQAWRDRFIGVLRRQAPSRSHLVDQTQTVPGTDFPITTTAAAAVIAVIARQPADMTVSVDSGLMTVSGVVPDAGRHTAIVSVLHRLFGADKVIDQTRTKE